MKADTNTDGTGRAGGLTITNFIDLVPSKESQDHLPTHFDMLGSVRLDNSHFASDRWNNAQGHQSR